MTKITCYVDQTKNSISYADVVMSYIPGAVAQLQKIGLDALGNPTVGLMTFSVDRRVVESLMTEIEKTLNIQLQYVDHPGQVTPQISGYVPMSMRLGQ